MATRCRRFLGLIFAVFFETCLSNCPSQYETPNCECRGNDLNALEIVVDCRDIQDPESFKRQMQALNSSVTASVKLENFNLPYFANGTFAGTNIKAFYMSGGSLTAFSEGHSSQYSAFAGMETTLRMFYAYGVSYIEAWDWRHLRNLKSVMYIFLQDCEIKQSLNPTALVLIPLTRLFIRNSNFSDVGYKTFSLMSELAMIDFTGNGIANFERSHLPTPALQLQFICLRNNRLSELEYGMFDDLPALRYLDVSFNQLMTLSELTFDPVWPHLAFVFLSGNPLECDNRLSWLLKPSGGRDQQNDIQRLLCHSPPRLSGHFLRDLYDSDLETYNNDLR